MEYIVISERKDYGDGGRFYRDVIEAGSPEEAKQIARKKRTGIENVYFNGEL